MFAPGTPKAPPREIFETLWWRLVGFAREDALAFRFLELQDHLAIYFIETAVVLIGFPGPVRQVGHDAFQVFDAIGTRFGGIVPQVFILTARIIRIDLRAEPIPPVLKFFDGEFVQQRYFVFRCLRLRHPAITPLNGPFIIVANAGK